MQFKSQGYNGLPTRLVAISLLGFPSFFLCVSLLLYHIIIPTELEELRVLDKTNSRRSDHLKHVQSKNFSQKEEALNSYIGKDREASQWSSSKLEASRKKFITGLYRQVFPIEVLPLSHEDQGAEG